MIIIGIDPGPEKSAVVTLKTDDGLVLSNCSLMTIEEIQIALKAALNVPKFVTNGMVAIEGLGCYGKTIGSTTIDTAYVIGDIRRQCLSAKIPHQIIEAARVRHIVAGNRHAKPGQVKAALCHLFKCEFPPKRQGPLGLLYGHGDHGTAALAVAMAYHLESKINL